MEKNELAVKGGMGFLRAENRHGRGDRGASVSPEPRDHFGEADHLLDAVADQVGQVWEHGELGEVDVNGGALVVLLGEVQVGKHLGLHGLWREGRRSEGPWVVGRTLRARGGCREWDLSCFALRLDGGM